jgi:recombination protein RecA
MILKGKELKSALIGMVIGDGCLSKRHKNGNANMQMNSHDLCYLLWKEKIINNLVRTTIHPIPYKSNLDSKKYTMYHLGSHRHPKLTGLYKRFYHENHKCLDEHLVKMIDPLALAIMYMDDGTFGKAGPTSTSAGATSESFYLCTQSFDFANNLLLKKSLRINFGLEWNPGRVGKSKKGTVLYRLRLRNKDNNKFMKLIKPYVDTVPSMKYKLGSYANIPISGIDIV